MFTLTQSKKKPFFIIMIILITMTALSAQTLGDVNSSGSIDIVDALLIAQYYVGLSVSDFTSSAADVDGNGSISIVDSLLVAQYYVGLIIQFPASSTPAPTPQPTAEPVAGAIGWASVNYLGQNGTTGGAGGVTVDVYDIAALKNAISDSTPRTVVIHGTINTGTPQELNVYANKTIIGEGSGAYLDFGFYMRGNNIILRNLDIWNGGEGDTEGYDGVSWADDLHHFWIDHCTFHECTDGAVDPTRNVRFVTISYCRFYSQNKTMLIGAGDDDPNALAAQSNSDKREWHYTVTVHHNWFQQTTQRHPRVRFGAVHVFNNYYDNLGSYAIGRGDRANIYSEANYFYNAKVVISALDDSSNPGYVKDVNSLFEGTNGNATDNPPSGTWVWQPSQYYGYSPHSASWVKSNLKNYAGVGKSNP